MPSVDTLNPVTTPSQSIAIPQFQRPHASVSQAASGSSSLHRNHAIFDLDVNEDPAFSADKAITASEALAASAGSSHLHSYQSTIGSPLRSHRNSYFFSQSKSFLSSLPEDPTVFPSATLDSLTTSLNTISENGSALTRSLLHGKSTPRRPRATLTSLPPEILAEIMEYVMIMSPRDTASAEMSKLLTTCFAIYDVAIPVLYRKVAFDRPHAFDKFRHSIERSGYGVLVRSIDFSNFTSVGLGRTGKMMMEIQMVTSTTILGALELCPNLYEFFMAESIEMDIDSRVINKLMDMPRLKTVDFCGATSKNGFVHAIENSVLGFESNPIDNLTSVSFHGCSTITAEDFAVIFPKFTNVSKLDLTHTLVTPDALLALPASCKLTHLSLAKCIHLDSHGLLKFLLLHPAAKHLEWLNIMFDAARPSPISVRDFDTIMRYLPWQLRYLNLSGLPVTEDHLKYLSAKHDLESLSLGYAKISVDALVNFLPTLPNLKYVDLTGNPNLNLWVLQDTRVFNANPGIDIFEFRSDILSKLRGVAPAGFQIEDGRVRRGWIHRQRAKKVADAPFREREPSIIAPSKPGFSFSNFAQERLRQQSNRPMSRLAVAIQRQQNSTASVEEYLRVDEDPSWELASRKINMAEIGIGGSEATVAYSKLRGIYAYYGYHI